jgi:hypothetical protein
VRLSVKRAACRSSKPRVSTGNPGERSGEIRGLPSLDCCCGPRPLSPLSSRPKRTRISYFARLATTTCAALRKESHMQIIKATGLQRKSRGAQWRDLWFAFPSSFLAGPEMGPSGPFCAPRSPGYHPQTANCGHPRLLFAYTRLMSRYDRPSHRVYMHFQFRSASGSAKEEMTGRCFLSSLQATNFE